MKTSLLNVSAVILISLPLCANAQLEGFAAGMLVDKIGDTIAETAATVIDDLEQAGTGLSFSVRSDLLVVSDNVAQMVAKERGKTFQQLNETQQAVLNNAKLAIAEARKGTNESLKQARRLTDQLGTDISRVPGVEKTAFITSYDPGFRSDRMFFVSPSKDHG